MSINKILEDWSDYDNKKIRDQRDSKDFACSESWEVDYLVNKIKKNNPGLTESQIRNAISECCKIFKAPHPRRQFVECVAKRLGISLN